MTTGIVRNIPVTGGCGRIGMLLVCELAGNHSVTILDWRRSPPGLSLPFVRADIADAHSLHGRFVGFDTAIHLAADPRPGARWESLFSSNVVGTDNVTQTSF